MKIVPELRTARTVLRNISPDDAGFIVRLRSDEKICRYFFSPHKITMTEHLDWYFNCYLNDADRMDWVAFTAAQVPLGTFGIKVTRDKRPEISYMLSPMYYGKGYATECVTCLIGYCQKQFKSHTVIATIHKDNTHSLDFIVRMGFDVESQNGDFIVYSKKI